MSRPIYWNEDLDSEDELWVCIHCGAELHADCVGDTCPVCLEKIDEYEDPEGGE